MATLAPGEKTIWSSVFARAYMDHTLDFKVDMRSMYPVGEQRERWRRRGAVIAMAHAADAIKAIRATSREELDSDLGSDAVEMLDAMQLG